MEAVLEVQARAGKGKGYRHNLLKRGLIPAVVYGKNFGSVPVELNVGALEKILEKAGSNNLIDMRITEKGKSKGCKVLVRAVQRDPVKGALIHADFHQVSLKDKVYSTVPIQLLGSSRGVSAGGILTTPAHRVHVECLAAKIPDSITVDISGLEIGEAITVADLTLPPDVKVTEEPHTVLVTVTAPTKAADEVEETAGEETAGNKNTEEPQ